MSNGITKIAGKLGLTLRKYSPEILTVIGIASTIGSTILACRATLKLDQTIEEAKDDISMVDEDNKRELTMAYFAAGMKFIKLYGPAVTLGIAGVASLLGAHGIMRKRNIALMAAYKAIETAFEEYRSRVVKELGEEKDKEFKTGLKIDKKNKGKSVPVDPEEFYNQGDPDRNYSTYARFFDENSRRYDKNSHDYNLTYLVLMQNQMNDLLQSRGHVFLNEVYEALDIPHSKAGAIVGWKLNGNGDGFIDFNIFDITNEESRDFVNGYSKRILLDFNVDGVIFDKLGE